MPLICPLCDAAGSATITHHLELPPDERSDEVSLQVLRCQACGASMAAIYEESRRGASESFHHFAFRLDEFSLARLKKQVDGCATPRDRGCDCEAHRTYAGRGAYELVTESLPLRIV